MEGGAKVASLPVVGVPVDVEDLEAHHGEQTRDDAFLFGRGRGAGRGRGRKDTTA